MSVKIKHKGLPSVLRLVSLVLLFLVVVLITGSIIYNLRNRNRLAEAIKPTPSPFQAYHEKFQALDFVGERMRLSLKADHFSVDGAGKQHLEGKVEIVDEESAGGVRLEAHRMVLDPEKKLARAEGEVRLVSGNLRLEAPKFEYDLKDKVARADQVRLERGSLSLGAGRLIYRAGNGRVELAEDIAGQIKQNGESLYFSSTNLIIEPDGLSFQGTDLKLTLGVIDLAAGRVRFRLEKIGSALDTVNLKGGALVRCRLPAEDSEFQEVKLSSERMLLQAGRDGSVLRAPGAFILEGSGNEWRMTGSGEELELFLEGGRKASRFRADRFRSGLKDSAGEEFWLAGQKADYDLVSGLLRLDGQAEARHRNFALESDRLEFKIGVREWLASGFNLEIRPGFFEQPTLILEKDKSVYLSGQQLAGQPDFFDLKGRVRIWQAEEFCQAEGVRLEGKTGRFLLDKLARASWLVERADGRNERLKLRADRAGFQSEENRGLLAGKVELSLGHLHLASEELSLAFSAETPGRLSQLEARGGASISWQGYRASGRRADFDLAAQKLALTGAPQLITDSGEKLEADKLTLFLADDRIRLENQKRERSLTILVRGQ